MKNRPWPEPDLQFRFRFLPGFASVAVGVPRASNNKRNGAAKQGKLIAREDGENKNDDRQLVGYENKEFGIHLFDTLQQNVCKRIFHFSALVG